MSSNSGVPTREKNIFDHYQENAARTANDKQDRDKRLTIAGLGLNGEAGEVADIIKKHIGHGHDLDVDMISDELGDVLWYIAEIASCLDLNIYDIAMNNIRKLVNRYPDGFSEERSKKRNE